MKPVSRVLAFIFFLNVLFCLGAEDKTIFVTKPAPAEREKGILVIDGGQADSTITSYTVSTQQYLIKAFLERGLDLTPAAANSPDSRERWLVKAHLRLEENNLTWTFIATDTQLNTVIAADSFSTRLGLTAMPLLESSARILAEKWQKGFILLVKGDQSQSVKKPQAALGLSLSPFQPLGVNVEYRYYPVPGLWFLQAANTISLTTTGQKGAAPVIHDEIRSGVALCLLAGNTFPLQLSLGTGLSGIFTWLPEAKSGGFGFDLLLDVAWIALEYHFPAWALVLENRLSWSTGEKTGYLPARFLSTANNPLPMLKLGVLLKW